MIRMLLVLLALAFAPAAWGQDFYILAGQSNLVGRAPLDTAIAPKRPDLIKVWSGVHWGNFPQPRLLAVSPGVHFADEIAVKTGKPVYVIQCAAGGTTMEDWNPKRTDYWFSFCVTHMTNAMAKGGKALGVLWYQGESDATTQARADAWGKNMKGIAQAFRDVTKNEDLRIVYAQIGPDPQTTQFPFWGAIQKTQDDLFIDNTTMIHTSDLTVIADKLHLDAASARTVGKRFARAMLCSCTQH